MSCTTRKSAAILLAFALGAAACGAEEKAGDSGIVVGQAPEAGAPSGKFKLPLPKAAVAEPGLAGAEGEAYRAPADFTLADVNAFYAAQVDNKPLAGFDWCGGVPLSVTQILRVWLRPSGSGQLRVALTEQPDKGVLIAVAQDDSPRPPTCPPEPPAGDQPFEGST